MIALILILIFYVWPFYACYTWIRKAHSKDGKWEYAKPDFPDFLFTILPVANIIAALSQLSDSPLKVEKDKTWLNKFFNIKK